MDSLEKKKYNKMENTLQYISGNFVALNEEDEKKVTPVLNNVIEQIIAKMKNINPLFNHLFETFFFGGSYYDGLKVGTPEEFDIDLKLVLPKLLDAKLEISNSPGFVRLALPGWDKLTKSAEEYTKFSELAKYKDEKNYLSAEKILHWMESIVTQALNKYAKDGSAFIIECRPCDIVKVLKRKSGPAVTLNISSENQGINLDVDLVATFKMSEAQWPKSPFRPLPTECSKKKEFLVVPKKPQNVSGEIEERLWRLSFQKQERVLMCGNDTFKPALRLMKKLRDTQNHSKMSSYFLKTVFLWEWEKQKNILDFWKSSLSFIFMHMLKKYRDCLTAHKIPYFWNKNNNLINNIDGATLDNMKFQITRMIETIDKKIGFEPATVASYILPKGSYSVHGEQIEVIADPPNSTYSSCVVI